jgi:hypothetical protein
MSWVKLDDQFFRHPKVIEAGRDARELYVASLCYSAAALTNGFIQSAALRKIAMDADIDEWDTAADRLVDAGLWEQVAGGWQVHDYLEYNPSADKVRAERSAARERMQRNRSENVRANNERSSENVQLPRTPSPINVNTPLPPTETEALQPAAVEGVGRADNVTPAFETAWQAYPARRGKKLNKPKALTAFRQIKPRDWDDVLVAIGNIAASDQGKRGMVEDMHRFLCHWGDWLEPEIVTAQPAVNGRYIPSEAELDAYLDDVLGPPKNGARAGP